MAKILTSPGKYVQGKGTLSKLGEHVDTLGEKILNVKRYHLSSR